jgi:hypothetical protein
MFFGLVVIAARPVGEPQFVQAATDDGFKPALLGVSYRLVGILLSIGERALRRVQEAETQQGRDLL